LFEQGLQQGFDSQDYTQGHFDEAEQGKCNAAVVFGPEGSSTVLYSSPLLPGKLVEYDHEQSKTSRVSSMQHQTSALCLSCGGAMIACADASGAVGIMQYKTGDRVALEGNTAICLFSCADARQTLSRQQLN